MSYLNDPREEAIRPESGVTLEQDNRVETMYHWGAMVLDLCDLPVEEYMKPMPVNVVSGGTSGGGDTPSGDDSATTYSLTYKVSGSVYATQTYHYGDTIVAPEDPEAEEGFIFVGWNGLPATMPKKSLTVTAIFQEEGGDESGTTREVTFYFAFMYNTELEGSAATQKIINAMTTSGNSTTATTTFPEHIILNVPGDDAYMDIETEEEEEAWNEEHRFSLVIAIPAAETLSAVTQGASEGVHNMVGDSDIETSFGVIEINGEEYKVTSYCKEDKYIVMDEGSAAPLQFYLTLE